MEHGIRLHEWLYDIVHDICYDREYIFLLYSRSFKELIDMVLEKGMTVPEGEYSITGIKSNFKAIIRWNHEHRLNYVGLNVCKFHCKIVDKTTGEIEQEIEQSFELSAGESIAVSAYNEA